MCRGNNHGGRRCPADTSEARRLRLHKAKLINTFSPVVAEKTHTENTVISPELEKDASTPVTVEQVKKDIDELQELLKNQTQWDNPAGIPSSKQWLIQVDQQIIKVGMGVEYLAETEFGAPTDAQLTVLAEAIEAKKLKIADEYTERLDHLHNEFRTNMAEGTRLANEWDDEKDAALEQYGLSRETHPIITERWAALEKANPELWAKLAEKHSLAKEYAKKGTTASLEHAKLTREKADKLSAIYEGYDSDLAAGYRQRNEAIHKTLEAIGVKLAENGSLTAHESSNKRAKKSVDAVTRFYPEAWVKASNERQHYHQSLIIKSSSGRAHYNDSIEQQKRVTKTTAFITARPADWKPDPYNRSDSEMVPMDDEGRWVDPKGGGILEGNDPGEGNKNWVSISYTYKEWNDEAGEPPATIKGGYKKVQLWERKINPVTGKMENTGKLKTYFRKPNTRTRVKDSMTAAELTITPEPASLVNKEAPSTRVAIHELAHRMERVVPEVMQMERAFLLRRAGILGDNPEHTSPIYSGEREMGYKDNFPTHYMGKVYNGKHYEILSMGMEALFEGTHGGLIGADGIKKDPDYKRAILGILAFGKK